MAQGGTGQLRARASILLPGLRGGGDLHGGSGSRRMLSYKREGSRHGTEPRFVTVRSLSPYIDKISCIFHVFCLVSSK